jgi:hypothetical protein
LMRFDDIIGLANFRLDFGCNPKGLAMDDTNCEINFGIA